MERLSILKTIRLSFILILLAGISNAATIRVPQDQPTIQAAIDAAVSGDTVRVAAGTYDGLPALNLKSGVDLIGSGASMTTLTFDPLPEEALFAYPNGILADGVSDITIDYHSFEERFTVLPESVQRPALIIDTSIPYWLSKIS